MSDVASRPLECKQSLILKKHTCRIINLICLFQAIHKIREFLMQKIYSFRKPMSNYQVPQNAMLKFRLVHMRYLIYICNIDFKIDTVFHIFLKFIAIPGFSMSSWWPMKDMLPGRFEMNTWTQCPRYTTHTSKAISVG